jgi:flagellar basal-body rod protein FlgB
MANLSLIDSTTKLLQKSLDLHEQRQQVISGNVANAETPGYARRSFEFEERLQTALKQQPTPTQPSNPRHFPLGGSGVSQVQGEIKQHPERSGFGDGNSVNLEDEMLQLSETQILYEASVKMIKRKLQILKYVANDGR